jgi:hypothetical protein
MISTSLNKTNIVNIADKKNKLNLREPLYMYFLKTPHEINSFEKYRCSFGEERQPFFSIVSSGSIILIILFNLDRWMNNNNWSFRSSD